LFTPYRQDFLTVGNIGEMRPFDQNQPILYYNQAAHEYIQRAPCFGAIKQGLKNAREIEKEMNAKADSKKRSSASSGSDKSDTRETKKVFTEEEIKELEKEWS
jgi:hypothetical protein